MQNSGDLYNGTELTAIARPPWLRGGDANCGSQSYPPFMPAYPMLRSDPLLLQDYPMVRSDPLLLQAYPMVRSDPPPLPGYPVIRSDPPPLPGYPAIRSDPLLLPAYPAFQSFSPPLPDTRRPEPHQPETLRPEVQSSRSGPRSGPNTKWANPRKGCEVVRVRAHSVQDASGCWTTTYYMESDGEWLRLESWERARPFCHREVRELRRAVFTYWLDHFDTARKVQFKMIAVYPGDYALGGFLRKWTPRKQSAHRSRLMDDSKRFVSKPRPSSETAVAGSRPHPSRDPVVPVARPHPSRDPVVPVARPHPSSDPAVTVPRPLPFRDPAITRRFRDAIGMIARSARSEVAR